MFAPLAGAYVGLLRNAEGFRFAHPWVLAAIPLAVALVLSLGLGQSPGRRALFRYPRADELAAQRPGIVARLRDLPTVLRLAAVVLLIVAAARPQSTRANDDLEVEGIDIVVALDLSGSMQETDLAPNRLEAAKAVIQNFVRQRPTDRIGLVVFGREAYTYAPMTLDHGALLRMVGELRLGIVDGNGTAIGDGIAVALNRLCGEALQKLTEAAKAAAQAPAAGGKAVAKPPEPDGRSKVLIVLTDGEDNASKLSPEDAARLAQTLKVKVYTILAGNSDAEGGGRSVNPKLLEEIASMTGGTPYLASDSRALKDRFKKILDDLKRAPIHDRALLYTELYRSFVWMAFLLLAAEIALRLTRFSRIP
ncbi:MAG TPA: VWA domain-containing protein [Polyangia bacterium]|nr:VWA domain-containing protein [Polyangia bacterium]